MTSHCFDSRINELIYVKHSAMCWSQRRCSRYGGFLINNHIFLNYCILFYVFREYVRAKVGGQQRERETILSRLYIQNRARRGT